jgi:hypothetical protein
MRALGMPDWIAALIASNAWIEGTRETPADDFGDGLQIKSDLCDHAQRALRTYDKSREIVAGCSITFNARTLFLIVVP